MEIAIYVYKNSLIVYSSMADARWWLLFVSIFFPWVLWWKLVDKTRLFEILCFGLFWAVMATWLDLLGTTYNLWSYPFKLNDQISTLFPADAAVIPVMYMILYQYASSWKSYLIGSFLIAIIFSLIFEPLFILLNMLDLKTWSHLKSVFSFFILAILTKGLFHSLVTLKEKN